MSPQMKTLENYGDVYDALLELGYEQDNKDKDIYVAIGHIRHLEETRIARGEEVGGFELNGGISAILSYPDLFDRFYKYMTTPKTITTEGVTVTLNGGLLFNAKDGQGSEYRSHNNRIYLDPEAMFSDNQYTAVIQLAHELGHALSPVQVDDSSLLNYVQSQVQDEAESVIWEFKALYNIYIKDKLDDYQYWRQVWKNNEAAPILYKEGVDLEDTKDKNKEIDFYDKLYELIIESGKEDDVLREDVAKICSEWLYGSSMSFLEEDSPVQYTYDEVFKLDWLLRNTHFAVDYWESMGIFSYSRDASGNLEALREILKLENHAYNIKVLVNQANNYLGKEYKDKGIKIDDPLEVKENGSVLGQAEKDDSIPGSGQKNEVLWGGAGNDTLKGGDSYTDKKTGEIVYINDILLGGEGNDKLYGKGGNDRLAGNTGEDKLFGGDDDDHLYGDGDDEESGEDEKKQGQGGSDHLYGGEGNDHLWGGMGDDYLYGEGGEDYLHGGTGLNYLDGGKGEDTYYIGAPDEGGKIIFDFQAVRH